MLATHSGAPSFGLQNSFNEQFKFICGLTTPSCTLFDVILVKTDMNFN